MKPYLTKTIARREELDACPVFRVDNYQWTCLQCPRTEGRMAYLRGEGLLLRMTCHEKDPKRALHNHRDMVCTDSAMEAFFAFPDSPLPAGEAFVPTDDGLYLNLEVNANGALYAKHGHGRKNRTFFTDEEVALTGVRAWVEPDRWSMELLLPLAVLERLCGIRSFEPGDSFYCNFYKIAEDSAIEHYASYSPIGSDTPNFHLPRFFARAVIAE